MVNRVKDEKANDGATEHITVLKDLTSSGKVQLTESFKENLQQMVPHTTYRRLSEIIVLLIGLGFNKDILWDIISELDISGSETYDVNSKDYDLALIDGSGGKGKHSWYVFIGLNISTGEMIPIHHSVGVPLSEIKKELESKNMLNKGRNILVVDGEAGMHKQFLGYKIQMCAFHFEQAICYKLWERKMKIGERKKINTRVQQILNTLKNSVKKNAGHDPGRLKKRILSTKDALLNLANDLSEQGYTNVKKFILKHIKTVTLFATEAINLVKIPWTNNIMERFIGEVSFRIKNRWAHWSDKGLNTIIYLIIKRYCGRNRLNLEF